MLKVKLIKTRTRDARIRNNQMFEEDEDNFFRNTGDKKEYKQTFPSIDRFVTFWVGIWEDDTKIPKTKWMQTAANKIKDKVTQLEEMTVDVRKLHHNEKEKELVSTRDRWYAKLLVEEASKHIATACKRYELLD